MTLVDDAQAERIYASLGPATEVSGGSAANTAACLASLGGSVRLHRQGAGRHPRPSSSPMTSGPPASTSRRSQPPVHGRARHRALPHHGHARRREDHVHQPRHRRPAGPLTISTPPPSPPPGSCTWRATCTATGPPTGRRAGRRRWPGTPGRRWPCRCRIPFWVELHRGELDSLLDRVDMLFANEQEACGMAGRADARRPPWRPWPAAARRWR